ncbi:MAG TPA: helical backbone metal receptor [Thermoanaerobaculia bacterium]|nr:helical backbone metal receptor [Thermoanaerobaculia bacterium]
MKPLLRLALLFALLAGCRQEGLKGGPASEAAPATTCRRVIALTPSLVETLFALGLGDRVVGVGDYSTWPPEVRDKPRLGGLFNPNLERVLSLKPDLAVFIPSERDLAGKLEPLGIDTLVVPNESLAEVEQSFHTIARRCGVPEAGEKLTAEWRAGLAPEPLPGPPLRVMLSVGRQAGRLGDMVIAGKGTSLHELLERLGAENAFADAPGLYPRIGLEEVVGRAPDIILELRVDPPSPELAASLRDDWQALAQIPAVRNGRIEVIAGDYTLIPGPRLPRLYREMRAALSRGREAR